jgi:hypothetical protein
MGQAVSQYEPSQRSTAATKARGRAWVMSCRARMRRCSVTMRRSKGNAVFRPSHGDHGSVAATRCLRLSAWGGAVHAEMVRATGLGEHMAQCQVVVTWNCAPGSDGTRCRLSSHIRSVSRSTYARAVAMVQAAQDVAAVAACVARAADASWHRVRRHCNPDAHVLLALLLVGGLSPVAAVRTSHLLSVQRLPLVWHLTAAFRMLFPVSTFTKDCRATSCRKHGTAWKPRHDFAPTA